MEGKLKSNSKSRVRRIVSFFSSLILLGVCIVLGTIFFLKVQGLPVSAARETTEILDAQGQIIDTFYAGQNRKAIPLSHISPYVIQATIAIEDHRFYNHFGVDLQGLARAVVVDLQHMEK